MNHTYDTVEPERVATVDHPTRTQQGALFGALAKAQGAYSAIAKNRNVRIQMKAGGSYQFRYADIEAVLSATRPALSANGLALIQTIETVGPATLLRTALVHSGGGEMTSTIRLPSPSDSDPKAFGAVVTYYRRYAACAVLGVAADDDLDENGEGGSEDDGLTAMLKNAREAAQKGTAEYTHYWTKILTAEQRVAMKDHHDGMKKLALSVDKAGEKAAKKAEEQVSSGGADPAQG